MKFEEIEFVNGVIFLQAFYYLNMTKTLYMENPFELILERLESIEKLLKNHHGYEPIITPAQQVKEILTIEDASDFLCLSKSSIYKRTSGWTIPFYKVGKTLYFKRTELMEWIDKHKVRTREDIEDEARANLTRPRTYRRK